MILTLLMANLKSSMEVPRVKIPSSYELDGKSLVPLIQGQDWEDRVLFTDYQRIYTPTKWRKNAVMSERWRLLDQEQIFDIDANPAQQNNVAKDYPEVVESLAKAYDKMWSDMESSFAIPTFITVGTEYENPTILTSHDWRGEVKDVP